MSHGTLLVFEVTILVLAIFLGFEVISKVPTLLHTPLMSGTNAIHGIVIVGAMLVSGSATRARSCGSIGFLAVVLGSANVVGGFVVTDRMLEMFKKRSRRSRLTRRRTARAHEQQRQQPALPDHDRDVHPRAALPLQPGARAARQPDRRGRHGHRRRRHVDQDRRHELVGARDRDAARRRLRCRRGAPGEDDRDAADGGAVQRRRRRRGRADRARRAAPHPPPAGPAEHRHRRRDRALRPDRRDLVRRLDGRVREAAGADQGPPDHVSGPEGRQPRPARRVRRRSASRSSPASRTSGCCGRSSPAPPSSASCSCCRSAAPTCRS